MLFSPYCREFNSLQKKIYSTFTQDQYFIQKIKSYDRWSTVKLTVKFYLAPRVRNPKLYLVRNGKIYLAPNDSFEKFYFAVKGLRLVAQCISCNMTFKILESCIRNHALQVAERLTFKILLERCIGDHVWQVADEQLLIVGVTWSSGRLLAIAAGLTFASATRLRWHGTHFAAWSSEWTTCQNCQATTFTLTTVINASDYYMSCQLSHQVHWLSINYCTPTNKLRCMSLKRLSFYIAQFTRSSS